MVFEVTFNFVFIVTTASARWFVWSVWVFGYFYIIWNLEVLDKGWSIILTWKTYFVAVFAEKVIQKGHYILLNKLNRVRFKCKGFLLNCRRSTSQGQETDTEADEELHRDVKTINRMIDLVHTLQFYTDDLEEVNFVRNTVWHLFGETRPNI